jgi:hypothetical protein
VFQRWLFWPFFAAIMGFALGGSFAWGILYVPPQQNALQNQQPSNVASQREQKEVFWENASDPVALFTGVLAVSTIGLWIVTWRMMSATRDSVNLAREEYISTRESTRQEFTSTHRPRLRVRQFTLDTLPPTPDKPLIVSFATINIGETSANLKNVAGEVTLKRGCFFEHPINRVARPINSPIRSGARHQTTIQSRFNVTAAEIGAIKNGELIICALGELEYADDLGVKRRTGFQRNYDVGSDMFTATPNQEYEYED